MELESTLRMEASPVQGIRNGGLKLCLAHLRDARMGVRAGGAAPGHCSAPALIRALGLHLVKAALP